MDWSVNWLWSRNSLRRQGSQVISGATSMPASSGSLPLSAPKSEIELNGPGKFSSVTPILTHSISQAGSCSGVGLGTDVGDAATSAVAVGSGCCATGLGDGSGVSVGGGAVPVEVDKTS